MTDEAKALVERLRNLICHGNLTCDTLGDCDAAAALIETQAREIERLRERVKQLNEGWDAMGTKGQAIIDRLSAENARLRDALNQVLLHRYGDWTDIARAALAGEQ